MIKATLQTAIWVMICLALPLRADQRFRPKIITSTSIGDAVFTHIVDGGVWRTTITLVNLADTAVDCSLYFYGNDGKPQAFSFVDIGTSSKIGGSIPSGGSVVLETAGTSSTTTEGWALLDTSDEVSGFAIFKNLATLQEVTVPLESWIVGRTILAFDNLNGYAYGVALVNPNSESIEVTVTFRNPQGVQFASGSFTMAAGEHTSFMFADRFPLCVGRRGTADFRVTAADLVHTIAVLGLRAAPTGSLTSVHALSGTGFIVN